MYIIILKLENQLGAKRDGLNVYPSVLLFMTYWHNCESQKVQNNMNSGIGVYFTELCISIIAKCIGSYYV